ncbi:odorant receptor 49b-like isoform X1 [Harmonia axyridis]|uniref:odorant receptor 49b-like isoform X1 n=1 Tax=Harmonia axyridis TaxID=115357 RepID=UPI001E275A9E|nr:odorant receptor 49b-like isoform X1 [Harmonia axyridis]XP_045480668.1 odorant receptor 49b-like isoform X1 [Harmonia axyridis]
MRYRITDVRKVLCDIVHSRSVMELSSFAYRNMATSGDLVVNIRGTQGKIEFFLGAQEFMKKFFGFGCLMCSSSQLTILYWYGEVLSTESVGISDAIYESEWYDADTEIRKTMLIMMRRSQRCLVLTVGKFEKVALKTVLRILKSIYTCMSILIQRQ